jgi:putative NIF3 family GTP cyclohydrolase 1 type 2
MNTAIDKNIATDRRRFIANVFKTTAATAFTAAPGMSIAKDFFMRKGAYTVQDVIDLILKEIPGAPFQQTVDTIKSGSPDAKVTGIVTTMFATIDVIKQAAQLKANFIIAHEPTFYNHIDDINWVADNHVVREKQALLSKNDITVWRFHDYWHAHNPDGIGYGVLKRTDWLQYYKPPELVLNIPRTSLNGITLHLKSSLGIERVRVIGDPAQTCERVALLPGAAGGQMQIALVEKEKPDVLIVGEVHEWETAEYIRDARILGNKTALVVLGHALSEEPGMEYLVEWLQPKLNGIKITHVASNNPFTWV